MPELCSVPSTTCSSKRSECSRERFEPTARRPEIQVKVSLLAMDACTPRQRAKRSAALRRKPTTLHL
eukprot:6191213-Pleurochrysis_carterae.AAC.1